MTAEKTNEETKIEKLDDEKTAQADGAGLPAVPMIQCPFCGRSYPRFSSHTCEQHR